MTPGFVHRPRRRDVRSPCAAACWREQLRDGHRRATKPFRVAYVAVPPESRVRRSGPRSGRAVPTRLTQSAEYAFQKKRKGGRSNERGQSLLEPSATSGPEASFRAESTRRRRLKSGHRHSERAGQGRSSGRPACLPAQILTTRSLRGVFDGCPYWTAMLSRRR